MSKISKHLNSVYDSLGKRQKRNMKESMNGQVLQANEDGFTDVCTMQEAARLAGLSYGQLYGYVKAGVVRRVMLPGRTFAVGVNIEDVRKLIVSLGTTVDLSTAARKLGVKYITASSLLDRGRLAAAKVEGCGRKRVTIESLQKEIEYRGGKSGPALAAAVRRDNRNERPTDELIEALAAGLRKQLEERRAKREQEKA
jgi:hypothetical protein